MSIVAVRDLRVKLSSTGVDIVSGVSFSISEGEVLALVGESGSGKSTVAGALLGYARRGAEIAGGSVEVMGHDVLSLDAEGLRAFRGGTVAYVPQDPAAALNPSIRVGAQLREVFEIHRITDRSAVARRIAEVLEQVNLPGSPDFLRRFPHQLSGGQQQRVCLAMAFLLRPKVIVMDEPTTGLDVTTQARILATMQELCARGRTAALYVTHDLAVVASLADHVGVMTQGRLVELASKRDLFTRPAHAYTRELLDSVPDILGKFRISGGTALAEPMPRPVASDKPADAPVLSTRRLSAHYGAVQVLHDIDLEVRPGECVAVVGESGSGKTTLSRSIIGLHAPSSGQLLFRDAPLGGTVAQRSPREWQKLQYIFQSPYNSLNPRRTVEEIVAQSLRQFSPVGRREARVMVSRALDSVSLPAAALRKYPAQLSGGERQRVAIARALVCQPEVLICDEVTSALDVSVQASIIDLLTRLQAERGLAMIFVTHNLALVRSLAQRVVVMRYGRVVEAGATDDALDRPGHPYTQQLVADTPSLLRLLPRVDSTPALQNAIDKNT